jgi:hypothetical protein
MRLFLTTLVLASIASIAAAQNFNIDVGDNTVLYPPPQDAYAGAAAQTGRWNASIHPYSTNLVHLDGTASTATTSSNCSNSYNYFPSPLTGDDRYFMVDIQDLPNLGGPWTWTFNGLQNGSYVLYTYAWAPENNGNQTRVTVPSSTDPAQDIGGLWSGGAHVLGVTYALHHLTVSSGSFTLQAEGLSGHDGSINGFQLVFSAGGGSTIYCTAKTNSLGCLPSISSTGTPSATAGSGFNLVVANVLNNKNGLFFYGVNGRAALPFQGGTLCVKSPVKRTFGIGSGGNPPPNDCSGIYTLDMNAFAVSSGPPAPLPALTVPGTVVDCQVWGRDPGFAAPNNTTLSNGLEYTVGP